MSIHIGKMIKAEAFLLHPLTMTYNLGNSAFAATLRTHKDVDLVKVNVHFFYWTYVSDGYVCHFFRL